MKSCSIYECINGKWTRVTTIQVSGFDDPRLEQFRGRDAQMLLEYENGAQAGFQLDAVLPPLNVAGSA